MVKIRLITLFQCFYRKMEEKNVSSGCMGMVGVGKNRGKNEPNQTKLDAEVRREQARKAQQDVEPAQDFPVPRVRLKFQAYENYIITFSFECNKDAL